MSSAAAWQPVPYMATYAATKAFELHLTEAIAAELRGTGVRALAVCPGPTRTQFGLHAGTTGGHWAIPFDDTDLVVRATWRALAGGRPRAGDRRRLAWQHAGVPILLLARPHRARAPPSTLP